ncbi:MAG: hypothetical protein RJA44_1632 [Pseudomonadota bacterium]|jgi:diguanylate cyclase (GGDEF)-like protein
MNIHQLLENFKRRMSLLIVDDDPGVVHALHKILSADYDIKFALSGRDALRMIDNSPPDLVLLDIELLDMSGLEVCLNIKQDPLHENLSIIFLTSHTQPAVEIEALASGGSDFIHKPFVPELVQARLRLHANLKLQHDVLSDFVYIDGLTGLANRRNFDEALPMEWRLCRRHSHPMSLLMLDIDHFKLYNDHYGHLQGDICLKQVAVALKQGFRRPHDLVARYGGEEFVCLLPRTHLEAAMTMARQVQDAVRALHLPHARSPLGPEITISIGVACAIPSGEHPEWLVQQADQALYQAKTDGRNTLRVADLIQPGSPAS